MSGGVTTQNGYPEPSLREDERAAIDAWLAAGNRPKRCRTGATAERDKPRSVQSAVNSLFASLIAKQKITSARKTRSEASS